MMDQGWVCKLAISFTLSAISGTLGSLECFFPWGLPCCFHCYPEISSFLSIFLCFLSYSFMCSSFSFILFSLSSRFFSSSSGVYSCFSLFYFISWCFFLMAALLASTSSVKDYFSCLWWGFELCFDSLLCSHSFLSFCSAGLTSSGLASTFASGRGTGDGWIWISTVAVSVAAI